ncbi:MAG: Na(+)-translocating NADH-quinone reductase subunit C, partial [Melioribacteraceae bacterium]|nr:Na(+)-translocating NADH-quinone reductase subunit C [Melioribacteraceae bacterium]
YKSISKQIQQLNLEKNDTTVEEERQKIESKIQTYHKELDKISNIVSAGDLNQEGKNPREIFNESIKPFLIELETGNIVAEENFTDELNISNFNIKEISVNPNLSASIEKSNDIADIKRKPNYMVIYEVIQEGKIDKYILPIYGKGLWSTLYGFIALDKDLKTIKGLTFYEHGETPGLGGEVDNPRWKNQWKGKQAFDEEGNITIEVIKGIVDRSSPKSNYQIDGLSGSTITTRGVDNLVKFWLGEQGYGPFFAKQEEVFHEQI